jgi:hypothetical protein
VSDTPETDQRIYVELWISFTSLIRSYVAAHDIGRPVGRALVDDGEDGRLTVRTDRKILTIVYDAATGKGTWGIFADDPGPERELNEGSFQIDTESMVEFGDRKGRLELEIAAEAFTAKIFDEE